MITLIIIAVTCAISIMAFNNTQLFEKLLLSPYKVMHKKEYYRILTHGFLHADWTHLLVNMFVLWSFGMGLQSWFDQLYYGEYIASPTQHFLTIYLGGIVISSLSSIVKNKNSYYYSSVGASGAVSAVVFATIFFEPWQPLYFFGIIPIPGILFGAAYLFYSQYMSRKGGDNINHDAHFYGAVFGFIYPILIDPSLALHFFNQLVSFNK
ncbi:rhomboid family intramembrane serine protease [uncultured Acetobacteroides sp.]|uniref:rhomboid family intramembrane serine protease n=1 Tax=uncultured Acetobacteroides sp. TaxID=1760811 RepID=UPI0029F5528C|nr:rhomboid family intramembrane serine protease [uncultured Acetobacteroides sp.]